MAKLARIETKAKDHDEKIHTFSSVSLVEVLKLADAKLGKDKVRGRTLAKYLLVEAIQAWLDWMKERERKFKKRFL